MSMRIATRGSTLALVQARLVQDALTLRGDPCELVVVETEGDRRAPDTAWGEGAFVVAIERALTDGRADLAVHSAKDVPLDGDPRVTIAAYLPREDPRDALVVRAGVPGDTVMDLPPGATVGTDSPRRAAFLRAMRHDLVVRPIHGNVDSRLRRLDDGEADALVLAVAGLVRLGRAERITSVLGAEVMPPAPGQGAIAVQVRADDPAARAAVARLDHPPTRRAVEVERAFLDACGGGCRAAVGALATAPAGRLRLLGGLADGHGRAVTASAAEGTPPEEHASDLADRLAGADAPAIGVTRPVDQATPLVRELAIRGLRGVRVPAIAIEPGSRGLVTSALDALAPGSWVVVTSANGTRGISAARDDLRWAAVGAATATALMRGGAREVWTPSRPDAATLASELPVGQGIACLLVRGDQADRALPSVLAARGAVVHEVIAYRTVEAPDTSRMALTGVLASGVEAWAFASGSAVRGLLGLAGEGRPAVLDRPALCIGTATATVARAAGFGTVLVASEPTDAAIAELAATTLAVPA